jgi:endonuclease/exonuclease/phosphatase family metal-dependent hydrolase
MHLHIVSWNLHGVPLAAPRRPGRMKLAAIRLRSMRPRPDVIVLQEIFLPSDLDVLKAHIGDDYVAVDNIPQREYPPWFLPLANLAGIFLRFRKSGLVAFVHRRWEVSDSHFEEFRVQDLEIKFWEGNGYADKGFQRLDLRHRKTGNRVSVFNTHTQSLRSQHEIRKAQVSQLAAAAYAVDRAVPVLIAGDFNVRPYEPLYPTMTRDFRWYDLTTPVATCGDRFGYVENPRERTARRRDYIFALANARWRFEGNARFICNFATDVPYSDHHGLDTHIEIVAESELPEDTNKPLSRHPRLPLAVLAAHTLQGPSTRREWLLAVALSVSLAWRDAHLPDFEELER